MKTNFFKIIFSIFILMLLIAIFNFIVDPGSKFKNKYNELGNYSRNKNILVLSNIDERIFKKTLIENIEKKRDILILGSSRVMTIGTENFNKKLVFNSGVSGADLGDIIALSNIYIKKIGFPKKILIGIDPWLFNKNDDKRYISIFEEYNEFIKKLLKSEKNKIKEKNTKVEKLKYLIKFSTLKDSLKNLNEIKQKETFIFLDKKITEDEKGNIYLNNDRSLEYSKKYKKENNGNWNTYFGYQISNYRNLDYEKQKIFELFIDYCQNNSIEIIFFLPPYNPKHYDYIKKNRKEEYKIINKVEKYIIEIAKKKNIKLVGKYNDKRLNQYDFYDGVHMKKEKIREYYDFE
ncbi:hypothetical protein [Fusobacterium varium]|uniref:hypothetical protein n=1 Tax=Fusobacterium varium TaxID=856 RepID=UPI00242D2FE5|nr:hypothetical protein [Fusobacterium varium]MCF0170505.1 hypothetical protein [Fusobacterium varium]